MATKPIGLPSEAVSAWGGPDVGAPPTVRKGDPPLLRVRVRWAGKDSPDLRLPWRSISNLPVFSVRERASSSRPFPSVSKRE